MSYLAIMCQKSIENHYFCRRILCYKGWIKIQSRYYQLIFLRITNYYRNVSGHDGISIPPGLARKKEDNRHPYP